MCIRVTCPWWFGFWYKSTLVVPGKILELYGSPCNCYLNKPYLTWPYITNLASPALNLPELPHPSPAGGHLNPALNTVTYCQILNFESSQNFGENIYLFTCALIFCLIQFQVIIELKLVRSNSKNYDLFTCCPNPWYV